MAENPHYLRYIQDGLSRTPALVGQWTNLTLTALRGSSTDMKMANDRNLLFQVMETMQSQRLKLEASLAFHIQAEVESAGKQDTSSHNLDNMRLDQLPWSTSLKPKKKSRSRAPSN